MKLYEVLSGQYGSKFTLKVDYKDSEGKDQTLSSELTFDRFTMQTVAMIESKHNIALSELEAALQNKMATFGTALAWDMLLEKDEFNNNIEIFRKALDFDNLQVVGEALNEAIAKGLPEAKNEEGPTPTE